MLNSREDNTFSPTNKPHDSLKTTLLTMDVFSKIMIKQNSESDEVFYADKNSLYTLWGNIYEHEINRYKQTSLEVRAVKMIIYIFTSNPLFYSTRQKFGYLKTIMDNEYYNKVTKDLFVNVFNSTQRHLLILTKFSQNMKMRYFKVRSKSDLYMNTISQKQHNVVSVIHSKNAYLFTFMDLTKIIEASLTNSPDFFSSPLPIKNPYNNIPFTKANLYNMYFAIKKSDFVLSPLFHNYFLSNFNLKTFKKKNEVQIRESVIKNIMDTSSVSYRRMLVIRMITWYNLKKKNKKNHLVISEKFPANELVTIMTPYLRLFMSYLYTLDMHERYYSEDKLEDKLDRFRKFNSRFGHRIYSVGDKKYIFNMNHPEFQTNRKETKMKNYKDCHLSIDYESSDEENDCDEEEDEDEPGLFEFSREGVVVGMRDPSDTDDEEAEWSG